MTKKKEFPPGTKFSEWYVQREAYQDKIQFAVRRVVNLPDGKSTLERHPAKQYSQYRHDQKLTEDFATRLNGRDPRIERIKSKLDFNPTAWISRGN